MCLHGSVQSPCPHGWEVVQASLLSNHHHVAAIGETIELPATGMGLERELSLKAQETDVQHQSSSPKSYVKGKR